MLGIPKTRVIGSGTGAYDDYVTPIMQSSRGVLRLPHRSQSVDNSRRSSVTTLGAIMPPRACLLVEA